MAVFVAVPLNAFAPKVKVSEAELAVKVSVFPTTEPARFPYVGADWKVKVLAPAVVAVDNTPAPV